MHVRLAWDHDVSTTSPVIRGTWVTVDHVMSLREYGWTYGDILASHPELMDGDINACVEHSTGKPTTILDSTVLRDLATYVRILKTIDKDDRAGRYILRHGIVNILVRANLSASITDHLNAEFRRIETFHREGLYFGDYTDVIWEHVANG